MTTGLLRQPSVFEGFRSVQELVHADDLVVAEREHLVEQSVDGDAARATAPNHTQRREPTRR